FSLYLYRQKGPLLWPRDNFSVSGQEESSFETGFLVYMGMEHIKSEVKGQTITGWCGAMFGEV
ncbi:hypothetical protein AVEN_159829-1, partial [Araneus ventricosus]